MAALHTAKSWAHTWNWVLDGKEVGISPWEAQIFMENYFQWWQKLKADTRILKKTPKTNEPFGVGNVQLELIKSGEKVLTQACDNFVNVIWKGEN